jgi:hypothetical protein
MVDDGVPDHLLEHRDLGGEPPARGHDSALDFEILIIRGTVKCSVLEMHLQYRSIQHRAMALNERTRAGSGRHVSGSGQKDQTMRAVVLRHCRPRGRLGQQERDPRSILDG